MNKNNSNLSLIITIVLIFIFFFIILPIFDNFYNVNEQLTNTLSENNNLLFPNNSIGIPKLDNNKCSKKCCDLSSQWKLPSNLFNNDQIDYSKFIPSNISCNSNDTTGCLCMTKTDMNFLQTRGQIIL